MGFGIEQPKYDRGARMSLETAQRHGSQRGTDSSWNLVAVPAALELPGCAKNEPRACPVYLNVYAMYLCNRHPHTIENCGFVRPCLITLPISCCKVTGS
jgi:hypothetical protein